MARARASVILVLMTSLTRDDILKLARLSQLQLTDEEIEEFTGELTEILAYVEQLQAVETGSLEPTAQVTGLTNVMRPDEIKDYGYTPDDLLKNVPRVENRQIKVNKIL